MDHVLLVDDDRAELRGLTRALSVLRARLSSAESVAAAKAILGAGPVDVVVADHLMPDATGIDLLAWVGDQHPNVVGVLITGDPRQETAIRAINETRIFRFLSKPWTPDALRTTIAKACDLARLVRANDPRADVALRPVALPAPPSGSAPDFATPPVASESDVTRQWATLSPDQQHRIHAKVVDLLYDRRLCATLGVPYNDPGSESYKLYAYAMAQL